MKPTTPGGASRRLFRQCDQCWRPPSRAFCLVLSLLSCQGGPKETSESAAPTGSAASTDGFTSAGEGTSVSTPTTTAGGEPGICATSAPIPGGACAPYGVIATGAFHTCALIFGGKVRCWGSNDRGQLGQGDLISIGDDETPNTIPPLDLGEAAIQVAAGYAHTCALTENGRVYCWGAGQLGSLGYGNTIDIGDDEPASTAGPVPLNGFATQIVAGYFHTCALMSDGSVRCWGLGESGRLGTGSTADIGDDETPASQPPVDLGAPAVHISASDEHTCAVLDGGGVICWGNGKWGRLGQGNTENIGDAETPGSIGPVDAGAAVKWVATGAFHTCALTVDGEVRCWGSNGNGSLGSGNGGDEIIGDDEPPSAAGAVSLGHPAVAISAFSVTTCALLDDGTLRCWGGNIYGQLGYGHIDDIGAKNVPSDFGPVEVGGTATEVSVGGTHACAYFVDDSLRCWGEAIRGALGYGNLAPSGMGEHPCAIDDVFGGGCEAGAVCCIGDMPGEMPPPPVPYQ